MKEIVDGVTSAVVNAVTRATSLPNAMLDFLSEHKTEILVFSAFLVGVIIGMNFEQVTGMLNNVYSAILYLKRKLRAG